MNRLVSSVGVMLVCIDEPKLENEVKKMKLENYIFEKQFPNESSIHKYVYVGTGFYIGNNYCVTCRHVIKNKLGVKPEKILFIRTNEQFTINFELVCENEKLDLAVIKLIDCPDEIKKKYLRPLWFSKMGESYDGIEILSCGFPYYSTNFEKHSLANSIPLFRPVMLHGIISSSMLFRNSDGKYGFDMPTVVDVPYYPGMSGGPVVMKESGKLIGVATSYDLRPERGENSIDFNSPEGKITKTTLSYMTNVGMLLTFLSENKIPILTGEYAIIGVRNRKEKNEVQIDQIQVRENMGGIFGEPKFFLREQIFSEIEKGSSFATAFLKEGKLDKGKYPNIIIIDGIKFFRTDKERIKEDYLEGIPEF